MRRSTEKDYEAKIADLEGQLAEALAMAERRIDQVKFWQRDYRRLAEARRQGEEARQWAIDQALMTRNPDVIGMAKQIADFVYGPDLGADRPEENPS